MSGCERRAWLGLLSIVALGLWGAPAAVEAADAEPNTVVAVMQKGYHLHDRVLRPALVTVAKALEKREENPISDTDLD